MVVDDGAGGVNIAVVELTHPTYDAAAATATYDLTVLQDYEDAVDMAFQEAPVDLSALGDTFGAAHLFIDDCTDISACYTAGLFAAGPLPGGPIGGCWSWSDLACLPCDGRSLHDLEDLCNGTYPDQCVDICVVR